MSILIRLHEAHFLRNTQRRCVCSLTAKYCAQGKFFITPIAIAFFACAENGAHGNERGLLKTFVISRDSFMRDKNAGKHAIFMQVPFLLGFIQPNLEFSVSALLVWPINTKFG
nr:hypothetical protein [Marinicella sp. W31]MDC2878497.1 hypothetical protein [Marinicella sp. W31]